MTTDLYSKPAPIASKKKWSPLTLDYFKWLRPLIDLEGYGIKWKGSPIRCNTEENILAYRNFTGRVKWLNRFSKVNLEKHLSGEVTHYFVGGTGRLALLMIDIDCHGGEPDGNRFADFLLSVFPKAYHQPSTNGRGNHLFLVIDTQGYKPQTINALYKRLDLWLKSLMVGGAYSLSDVEVKGHIPYLVDARRYYCGTLAKIPLVHSAADLDRLKATPVITANQLLARIKLPIENLFNNKETNNNQDKLNTIQNILVSEKRVFENDKVNENKGLRAKKVCAKPTPENSTARRMKSAWEYVKEHGYVPTVEQLLAYIQDTQAFSPPWSFNEEKRRKDVIRILQKIGPKHDPRKANRNYNPIAQELLDGHTVTYGKRQAIHWQDLSLFLSILETVIVHRPNSDGSVPRDRIESLWKTTARRKHFARKWVAEKYAPMRDFLIAAGFLQMVDAEYSTGKAMRYTLGPAHPEYAATQRIYRPAQIDLQDAYILDRLQPAPELLKPLELLGESGNNPTITLAA